jgi:uncharacterized protein (DUF697 family)
MSDTKDRPADSSIVSGASLYFEPVTQLLQESSQRKADASIDEHASTPEIPRVEVRERATKWVNAFALNSAAFAMAAIIPGAHFSSAIPLVHTMALTIGRMYHGESFSPADAANIVVQLDMAKSDGVVAKLAVSEILSFIPVLGWAAKAGILTSVLKPAGHTLIEYFEAERASTLRVAE